MEGVKQKVLDLEASARGSKKELRELEELQTQYKHLANKRKEAVICLRQKYKIKVEGSASESAALEPCSSFA